MMPKEAAGVHMNSIQKTVLLEPSLISSSISSGTVFYCELYCSRY